MSGWREYHERTKHSVESLKRSPHILDWANKPDPFRHYEGVPLLDLPADPPTPEAPVLDVLHGISGPTASNDGPAFLSQLFFYSASISASKRVPSTGEKYALRVNPSSGNLHPTEFHFLTRGLDDWPDGLYHYRPSSHMAEQRAPGAAGSSPLELILTSIAWREAWKYGDRAYRYCLLDIGHAWQSIALAARAMGCDAFAAGYFPDDEVAQLCRLHADEWPMVMVKVSWPSHPYVLPGHTGGEPNRLSRAAIPCPRIDEIHAATKRIRNPILPPTPLFGDIARARRSALDFIGGKQSMPLPQLLSILAAATQPLAADFSGTSYIQLYAYVHRVDGLDPGVYKYRCGTGALEQFKTGDQRVIAAGLSLGQDLAGNACVAFSMIGDLERATRTHGDRGYRYVHFEAGAIGHRMYLAAEAFGLRATGIGAFYDDEVHRYLDIAPEAGQVVYHFAIGHPVPDLRLEA